MPDESPLKAVHTAGIFFLHIIVAAFIFKAHDVLAHDLRRGQVVFAQTVYNRLQFGEVELISRNHNIGPYRGGSLALKAWVGVDDDVFIGIDEQGRLFQVVQLADRTVAFLLSGDLVIRDFFFQPRGRLAAIDNAGQLYDFQWSRWFESSFPSALRRAAAISTGAVCLSWTACLVSASIWGLSPDAFPVLLQMGGLTSTVFAVQGLIWSNKYQMDNDSPSGLIPVGEPVGDFKSSDYKFDRDGRIIDLELKRRGAPAVRLSEILADSQLPEQNFLKTCEHELLARGVPYENN